MELEAKRDQVAQSQAQGHGKRLEQRQCAATELEDKLREAQQHEAHLQEQVDGFEAPKERADRDFRKQTIMTIRTLFLENLLQAFMTVLLSVLPKHRLSKNAVFRPHSLPGFLTWPYRS